MFKAFYPDAYMDSVFAIDYARLYARGYRGLVFDIDNTLVHHGDDSTQAVDALFKTVQGLGFKTLLLTNNEEKRVQRFIRNIDTAYICDAGKPAVGSYIRAVEMLGIRMDEAVCIGDQIFTDILGANRSGMASILVRFIRRKGEKRIGKRRYAEKLILAFYRLRRPGKSRLGDINKEEVDA